MPRGEAYVLLFLVVFSAVSFLPVWREVEFFGMAAFGWFMAALMVISPTLALFVFARGKRDATAD
jgi:membrane protein YqaA with SNARE-associated domain